MTLCKLKNAGDNYVRFQKASKNMQNNLRDHALAKLPELTDEA